MPYIQAPYAPAERYQRNSRLLDLLAQQGQQAAEAEARRGQQRGELIANIGQTLGKGISDVQQYRREEPERQLRLRDLAGRSAESDLKIRAAEHAARGQQLLAQALQHYPDDPETVTRVVAQAGHPDTALAYLKTAIDLREAAQPKIENAAPGSMARNKVTGALIPDSQVPVLPPVVNPETERHNRELERIATMTAGRAEATQAETVRHNRAMEARPVAGAATSSDDASAIADAIISGDQPPNTTGLYRLAGPVRSALAKKGYNLTTANLDWQATQKHVATLNGAQQTRLRQAVATAADSLGVIEDLAKQWQGGAFPVLNRANLALAKNGVLGPAAQQLATNLTAQITDVTSELGNVYMGGNSPTDHALALAGKNLSADWTRDQLLSAIQLARTNLQIRSNSMNNVGPAGMSTPPATSAPSAPAGWKYVPKPGGGWTAVEE